VNAPNDAGPPSVSDSVAGTLPPTGPVTLLVFAVTVSGSLVCVVVS
jgi:hypothetical protein